MDLAGIPEEVDRGAVLALIDSLGIDPREVSGEDGIAIKIDTVEVTLFSRDANGKRFVERSSPDLLCDDCKCRRSGGMAKTKVTIKITEPVHTTWEIP